CRLALLPYTTLFRSGGWAQLGVPTGTGSGAVLPVGGYADVVTIGGAGFMGRHRNLYLLPSSPVDELKRLLPNAQIDFDPGATPRSEEHTSELQSREN